MTIAFRAYQDDKHNLDNIKEYLRSQSGGTWKVSAADCIRFALARAAHEIEAQRSEVSINPNEGRDES